MKTSLESFYANKKILITGHSGFKGSWLSLLLSKFNSIIYGVSLDDNDNFSMFKSSNIDKTIKNYYEDIRDFNKLYKIIKSIKPDYIFHLAAKSLVLDSINNPLDALTTNVIGTANILEIVRKLNIDCKIIVVTSDKVYDNKNLLSGYREEDRLGGTDPYSMSKAAAELVSACWQNTYFKRQFTNVSTVRAGNVIGGGDWSTDRIVPDCIRSLAQKKPIILRNPKSIRPWQHVLEPLYGYLLVGKFISNIFNKNLNLSWNFGPRIDSIISVEELTKKIIKRWGSGKYRRHKIKSTNEHIFLNINSDKAHFNLGWKPRLKIDDSLEYTLLWYKAHHNGEDMYQFSLNQIQNYFDKSE